MWQTNLITNPRVGWLYTGDYVLEEVRVARIFTEGFEIGDLLCFDLLTGEGGGSIDTAQKRTGSYSMMVNFGTGYTWRSAYAIKYIDAIDECYIRFGLRRNTANQYCRPRIYVFSGDTNKLGVEINSSNYIEAKVGGSLVATGTTSVAASTWHLVEIHFKLDSTSGQIQVKINNTLDIDYSGDTGSGTFDKVYFGGYGVKKAGGSCWYDDIGINDTSEGVDDSWCGDGRIIAIKPNANGDQSDLVNEGGDSVDNYQSVDDIPKDDDTTYVESDIADDYDLYNLEACGLSADEYEILRVVVKSRVKGLAASEQIRLMIKTDGTEYEGDTESLGNSYAEYLIEYNENPYSSVPWTPTKVDALQIGMKVK